MHRHFLCALLALAGTCELGQAAEYARRGIQDPELILETGARTGACDVLLFTRDGKHLLACGDDKVVRQWSVTARGLDLANVRVLRWASHREIKGTIYAMALSNDADQRYLAIAGHGLNPGTVAILDRTTGDVVQALTDSQVNSKTGNHHTIWALAFAPSNNRVALGNQYGDVFIWDLGVGWDQPQNRRANQPAKPQSLQRLNTLPKGKAGHNFVRVLSFSAEKRLLSVTEDGVVMEWNLDDPQKSRPAGCRFQEGYQLWCAAIDPDRKWVAGGRQDKDFETIEVLSLQGGPGKNYKLPPGTFPQRLVFDARGERLAIGSFVIPPRATFQNFLKGPVYLCDLLGNAAPQEGPPTSYCCEGISFSPTDNRVLAVAGGDNFEVALWKLKPLELLGPVALGAGRGLWGVGLSPDGLSLGFQSHRDRNPPHPNERGSGDWIVFDLKKRVFLPADKTISTAFARGRIQPEPALGDWTVDFDPKNSALWYARHTPTGQRHVLPLDRRDMYPRCYTFLRPRPGGQPRLAVGHLWGISIYEMGNRGGPPHRIRKFVGHHGEVMALAPSADHSYLVSSSRDQTINFWSLNLAWETQPELGASFELRGQDLIVQKVETGSPLWHAGLSRDDKIQLMLVLREEKSKSNLLFLYDNTENTDPIFDPFRKLAREGNKRGEAEECLAVLKAPPAGAELVFIQKRPGETKPYIGAARVQQRPVWRFFPAFSPEGLPQDWVLWRWHDHVYDCSTNGDQLIGWQVSYDEDRTPDYYEAANFKNRYWKPETIRATLLKKEWTPSQIASVLDLRPPDLTLEIRDPATGAPVKTLPAGGKVKVMLRVRPLQQRENHQPERVYLWINDHRAWQAPLGGKREIKQVYEWNVEVDAAQLRQGLNRLSLQCYIRGDASAGETSAKKEVEFTKAGKDVRPRLFVVLVGVADYREVNKINPAISFPNLQGCAEDLKFLNATLKKKAGLFGDVQFTILQDNKAVERSASAEGRGPAWKEERGPVSPETILASLDKLKREARSDDILIFYLSGHGMADKGIKQTFTFICPRFDMKQPGKTGVTGEQIYDRLVDLKCRKLVLLDACHSGDVAVNPVRQLCLDGMGPVVISACRPDQSALTDDLEGSLFTQCVNEALSNRFDQADRNKDGCLDVEELIEYVRVRLKEQLTREQKKNPSLKQDLDYSPLKLDRTNFILLPTPEPRASRR